MSVLLLGNGINQLEGLAPSWGKLLEEIADAHGGTAEDSLSNTLGYEKLESEPPQLMQWLSWGFPEDNILKYALPIQKQSSRIIT